MDSMVPWIWIAIKQFSDHVSMSCCTHSQKGKSQWYTQLPSLMVTLVASLIRSFSIVQYLTAPSTVLSSFSRFAYGATSMKND
jgi:hypothetical protein